MLENREPAPQQSGDHGFVAQNPSHKERVDEKMERQRSPENELHITTGESVAETQRINTESSAQVLARDVAGSSTLNKGDAAQVTDQTSKSGSTNPFMNMSNEEFQKAKEQQLQKDEQAYQKAKEELQQIQKDEPQTSNSETNDPNEDYDYGMGQ
jgi:hypothetical protein